MNTTLRIQTTDQKVGGSSPSERATYVGNKRARPYGQALFKIAAGGYSASERRHNWGGIEGIWLHFECTDICRTAINANPRHSTLIGIVTDESGHGVRSGINGR
jgi:hypothetical protein